MYEAFVSQAQQHYPQFEILFGVSDTSDSAIPHIERLQREFPQAQIRLIVGSKPAANNKVGILAKLADHARYPVWVINDSDIRVTPDYLSTVVAPLTDDDIGVVTCLYRPEPHNAATTWEALGIATDFIPSTLVAQTVGVKEFGLGSTLAFRAEDWRRAGGFAAIADYLADDYQVAKRITNLGKQAWISEYVVETRLGEDTWLGMWQHQLRWARNIRITKGGGYAGLPITHAGVWALLAIVAGAWPLGMLLIILRIASGVTAGWFILRSRTALIFAPVIPLWDFLAFGIWLASYGGRTVRWRDRMLRIDKDGKIEHAASDYQ